MTVDKIIPWFISACSLLFVILTFAVNRRKDRDDDIIERKETFEGIKESLLTANVKLDQLGVVTQEMRADIKTTNTKIVEIEKELAVVKRDVSTAFMRIDELRDKIEKGEQT